MESPLSIRSFPRAIIHIDADSFFASCEQALHPELRGKPVITGKERGIASAVSIEAKKLGIKRGMSIREIKELCPDVIYVPSDYESYSLFSKRMFEIVRRYTPVVEEYSIDECFAEITGLRRPLHMSYEDIARRIKQDLEGELGITFSIGLAPTKVLAKIASKWNKPSGMVTIAGTAIHHFLKNLPVEDVWGIGPQTTRYLKGHHIETALEFARMNEYWISSHLTKPHREVWNELRGISMLELNTEEKHDYQSISKTKTFTPSSSDRSYILAQLSKNTENAFIKARRHKLAAKRIFFLLRTQDFKHVGYEFKLTEPTSHPHDVVRLIDTFLELVFKPNTLYRLTGVVLADLVDAGTVQQDLFGESARADVMRRVYEKIDALDAKYGKHTVYLGSSHQAISTPAHQTLRGTIAHRKSDLFRGETDRKRISIPMLGDVV